MQYFYSNFLRVKVINISKDPYFVRYSNNIFVIINESVYHQSIELCSRNRRGSQSLIWDCRLHRFKVWFCHSLAFNEILSMCLQHPVPTFVRPQVSITVVLPHKVVISN